MNIQVIGSTKEGYVLPKKEALRMGAKFARICYSQKDWEGISSGPEERLKATEELTLKNGHQSVHEHMYYNLYIKGLPKILAMFLNNENVYVTSEKSARYTIMKPSEGEKQLYNKWKPRLEDMIKAEYPDIDEAAREKLAMENARYLISVFTPTKMAHTLSLRQMNYVMHWFGDFVKNAGSNAFNDRVKASMLEFNSLLSSFYVPELEPKMKRRKLTLIAERRHEEFFDECYSANYKISFAGLGQAQRHRTIRYCMQEPSPDNGFFVPPILGNDTEAVNEWRLDMESVKTNYPQGLLLDVNERGIYEDFISKASERLCGRAQLEIRMVTKQLLERYIEAALTRNYAVHIALLPYSKGAKCTFPDFNCSEPCHFRAKSLEKKV